MARLFSQAFPEDGKPPADIQTADSRTGQQPIFTTDSHARTVARHRNNSSRGGGSHSGTPRNNSSCRGGRSSTIRPRRRTPTPRDYDTCTQAAVADPQDDQDDPGNDHADHRFVTDAHVADTSPLHSVR
eukprot:scaffold83236_cov36-Cyclotella_meneghiniana.AAC.3